MDNDTSEDATVVEASGRDRPGLLAALARTMADAGLSIQSAHIDNYGERAVDAFYVNDKGHKLEGRRATTLSAGALGEAERTLERLRARKTPQELAMLRAASESVIASMADVFDICTPGMTKPGKSVAPTQEGLPISKDVWMLGIGIGLLTRGILDRKARK